MIRKLQSAEEYIRETEPAVKDLFESLERYSVIRKKIKWPTFSALNMTEAEAEEAFKRWEKKNRSTIKRALEGQRKYFGYQVSIATLCGSILQIAYMGINLFSKNRAVPPEFVSNIKMGTKVAKFCVGRIIRGVPIGLIIYAGRNQYNHMDDDSPLREPNEFIFNTLATNHGIKGAEKVRDPAFDLKNEAIAIYSSNIIYILGWDNYIAYISDMKDLLITEKE